MSSNWKPTVKKVLDGEPVDQTTANRAITTLASQTEWLKARVDLMTGSTSISFTTDKLDTSVAVGDWVYFDELTGTYLKAIAEMEYDEVHFTYFPSRRSFAAGIVADKESGTSGLVVCRIAGVTLTDYTSIGSLDGLMQEGETFTPGRMYLSTVNPGKMTSNPSGGMMVSLGIFSEDDTMIDIQVKDVFESHFHHRFNLFAKPSASYTGSTGWAYRDVSGDDRSYVDYKDSTDSPTENLIQLSVKRDATKIPSTERLVVRIKDMEDGTFAVDLFEHPGGNTPSDIDSAVQVNTDSKILPWPEYGEEVAINWSGSGIETDLILAFVRVDYETSTRHDGSLADDVDSGTYTEAGSKWLVSIPDDYKGWTNANPVLSVTPTGARFRYITEGHLDFFQFFPPLPEESIVLYKNGSPLAQGTSPGEYTVNHRGLWWFGDIWVDGNAVLPWPSDYDVDLLPAEPSTEGMSLIVTFITHVLSSPETVVRSISSGNYMIKVESLDGSAPASSGRVQITLEPEFLESPEQVTYPSVVYHGLDSQSRLKKGYSVASLEAGDNVVLERKISEGVYTTNEPYNGTVKISVPRADMEGEVTSITLMNAKESHRNGVSYVEFLPPATAKTALSARIKVPNVDIGDRAFKLTLYGRWLGTGATSAEKTVVLKADYRVVTLSSLLATLPPDRTEYWVIPLPNSYTPYSVLTEEHPIITDIEASVVLTGCNLLADNSTITILPNDIISVNLERVAAGLVASDDYASNLGLLSLRWKLELIDL